MYVMVWSFYGFSCLVAIGCLWWMVSRYCRPVWGALITLPFLAVCFTPVIVDHHPLWLAPAIAAVALELVAGNTLQAMSYLLPVIVTVVLAFLPMLVMWVLASRKTQKS